MDYHSMEVHLQGNTLARCILPQSTYMFDDAERVMADLKRLPESVTNVVIDASRVTGFLSTEVLNQFGYFALAVNLRGGRLSIECAGNPQVEAHVRKFHADLCPQMVLPDVVEPALAPRIAA